MRSLLRRLSAFGARLSSSLVRSRRRTWAAAGAGAVLVTGVLVMRTFTVSCDPDVPCVTLGDLKNGVPLPEAMHVLDRFGQPLANVSGPRRRAIPEDAVPERLAKAWVAVEDRRFWSHSGVDPRGILRAAVQDIRTGEFQEGASTIPMQLVRTLWAESLVGVSGWRRKIIEARMAPKLVDALGRERVLTLYLNSIYMGNGLYGVGAASRYYFGVPPDSLSVAETATLVGMTRAPERYEPRRHPERTVARRNLVLGVLSQAGVVSPEAAETARATPLHAVDVPPNLHRQGYITAAVARAVVEVAPELTGRAGLYVTTTIDPTVQAAGQRALLSQLDVIERGRYGRAKQADPNHPLQGSAVAIDVKDGSVRAWIGGRDFGDSQFDRVAQAERQVGSLVKPFIVASAVQEGYGILDAVSSDTISIRSGDAVWSPNDHVTSPIMPMREALVHSSNRAAVHLGRTVGYDRIRAVAAQVGLDARIPDLPSAFIGSFEASLLDVTGAFAAFGNGGYRVEPHLVERIEDAQGQVLWQNPGAQAADQPLDAVTAFVVLDALQDVVDRGTGRPVRAAGYTGPAAGKTGTTNASRDAWFVGLVPDMAVGVWIGYDQPRTIVPGGAGGTLAGPVWGAWMKQVDDSLGGPRGKWLPPPGVREVLYDTQTGTPIPTTCHQGEHAGYVDAWIPVGDYSVSRCPGGFGNWLEGLWKAIAPGKAKPMQPLTRRPRAGG